nr:SPOR domain-containing protein [Paracidobacterium acidisoli]
MSVGIVVISAAQTHPAVASFASSDGAQPQVQGEQTVWFVEVTAVLTETEAKDAETTLKQHGYSPARSAQNDDRAIRLRVGPFPSRQQAEAANDQITALGFNTAFVASQSLPAPTTAVLTSQQADLETQALAKLSGSGAAPVSSSPADLESQAVQSMEAQTAENETEAARRRVEEEEQRRAAAERAAEEAQNTPPPAAQSGGGGFLNGLNGLLDAVNQGMQQGAEENAAISGPAINNAAQAAEARAQTQAHQQRSQQAETQTTTTPVGSRGGNSTGTTGLVPASTSQIPSAGDTAATPQPSQAPEAPVTYGFAAGAGNPTAIGDSDDFGKNSISSPCPGTIEPQWKPNQYSDTNQDLWFHSICAADVNLVWFFGHSPVANEKAIHAWGDTIATYGLRLNTSVSVYACPIDHPIPVNKKGVKVLGAGEEYRCATSLGIFTPRY